MFDMDPEAAKVFYKEHGGSAREMTVNSGIAALVPGATIDDFAFDPCGYSMNAITYGNYATVRTSGGGGLDAPALHACLCVVCLMGTE